MISQPGGFVDGLKGSIVLCPRSLMAISSLLGGMGG
jgi:hypothetical protein